MNLVNDAGSSGEAPRNDPAAVRTIPRQRAKRTIPPSSVADSPECKEMRRKAEVAQSKTRWSELLEATEDRSCWPDARLRARMRVLGLMNRRDYDACVLAGENSSDTSVLEMVQICKRFQSK
jgi:hypothetical protein